ncbi:hypothetical protein MF271_04975 [Deinococcus sp. KNUC1210]|uniref:hypothetical protein n=1 Tax=Deinococcus sp. KNUC1210 TaxID=2917691 RepID=UPI001EF16079|nr:hypothetical protein [Deinococcus sp. KNUC1210]ULH15988.1 hypothetical protein MF271_04975 [Deinococcus sp. KNUC1210]
MPGVVQKLTGVTFSGIGLPKLQRDAMATTGTLLVDAGNAASWAGGNPVNGNAAHDLANSNPDMT